MAAPEPPQDGEPVAEFTEVPLESGTVAGMWALFLGLGLLMVGNGLNGSVIGVRSGLEGFGVAVTEVIMAGYFAGFLLGPPTVVQMIPSVGHIRVFAGLASVASSAVLIHSITVFATRSDPRAIYMIVSMGGMAIGQLLLSIADPAGFTLFVVASVLVSMSLVPIALAATATPPPIRLPERVTTRELADLVPTGAVGAFMNGAAVGVLLGMGAVYATASGLSLDRTALFLAAPMIGAIVFQWPVGWISDRVPRRGVIFVVAAAAVIAAVLALTPADNPGVLALMLLLGGATFPLYSLVVSYTLDWTPAGQIVAMSGALVRLSGAGAIAAYVAYRIAAKDALPIERRRRFIIVPARASELVLRLAPKPMRRPKPD